ncbi:unnamed protein product, partial [Closterium sp. NIES-53]
FLNGTTVTCPPNKTSCVVTQIPSSAFCNECRSFCSTCVKTAPRPPSPPQAPPSQPPPSPTTPPSSSSSPPLSPKASPSQSGGGLSVGAIAGIAVAAVMLLIIGIGVLLWWWRGHKIRAARAASRARSMPGAHCTEYSLEEVLKATSNWSSDNQLGSGAFGDVYKGVCPHDDTTLWAVKRAKLIDVEFYKE